MNVIKLGKLPIIIVRLKVHELLLRLFSQIFGIHQKQDAFGIGMLEQAINKGGSGKGFSCTRCHLNQGAGAVLFKRIFQIFNGNDLSRSESGGIEFGQVQ